MIPTTLPEQAVLAARTYRTFLQVKIEDALGVFNDFSDYFGRDFQYLAEVSIDVDARVAQARVELVRQSSGNSLAPLLNSDIAVGRAVRIAAARIAAGTTPVSSDYKPLFQGSIDEWGHPSIDGETDENRLNLVARDGLAVLMDREIEAEPQYGSEDGTPLEEAMQAILDDWADGVQLYVPTATGTDAGPFVPTGSVLDTLQGLADLIGWVIEYRWDSVTAAWRVTLYEPDRTPTGTDWSFGPDDYYAVTQMNVTRYDIRNAITVWYTDAATGKRMPYTTADATSIAKYGRRWMRIKEADDSPINSAARAAAMADPALLDLSEPSAIQEVAVPLFWPVQLGDYYGFLANGVHYDVDQEFGVTGYTHSIQNGEGETRIRTRGKPVGSVRGWIQREHRERPAEEVTRASEIQNFRVISRTATEIKYGWTLGSDLAFSAIHNYVEKQPFSTDKWPAADRVPDSIRAERDVELTVTVPEQGYVRYIQVEGRKADGAFGDMERAEVFPPDIPGDYIAFAQLTVDQTDGSVKIAGWSTDRALSVAYAFNVGAAASTPPPTEAQAEAQGTGATGGGLVTGFTSDFEISLPAGTVGFGQVIKVLLIAYINANGTGPDGTAQDHHTPVGAQGERFKITDSDQIDAGVVIAEKLTESSRDFNFPADAFSATDWDTVAWSGFTLELADGSSYPITAGDTGNLASDAPRYIYWDPDVSTSVLQVTTAAGSALGERVLVLAVAKRASASNQRAFFVPAVGVFGINETQIGPNSIATGHIQALAIVTGHLAAGSVVAAKIDVAYLRAISADLGNVLAGYISNPTNTAALKLSTTTDDPDGIPALPATNFIDLTATGANPFIKHSALVLNADGTAVFGGAVASTTFTAGTAVFTGTLQVDLGLSVGGDFQHDGSLIGFFAGGPSAKITVTGSRGGNAALASLLSALEDYGLITDGTSA